MSSHLVRPAILLSLFSLVVAAGCGSSPSASSAPPESATAARAIVGTRHLAKLNADVLVDRRGRTLYTLSAESGGRFICTKTARLPGTTTACTSLWHPLIAAGPLPSGIPSLGTVTRPDDGQRQVTYNGLPLYTFTNDRAPGDATGNGFHDVGVWRAATVDSSSPPPSTSSGGSSGGGGYGY